jgi:hypothetical protein
MKPSKPELGGLGPMVLEAAQGQVGDHQQPLSFDPAEHRYRMPPAFPVLPFCLTSTDDTHLHWIENPLPDWGGGRWSDSDGRDHRRQRRSLQ